jgi:integrase
MRNSAFAFELSASSGQFHLLSLRKHEPPFGPRGGWLHLEKVDGPARDMDRPNEARRALLDYVRERRRDETSPYVFLSQRSSCLSEAGPHHWFRTLKSRATPALFPQIREVSFHDLRDDFAYRAREAGWTEEEVAYYLGYITSEGALSLRTTARYTQLTRAQAKEKLKLLKS